MKKFWHRENLAQMAQNGKNCKIKLEIKMRRTKLNLHQIEKNLTAPN